MTSMISSRERLTLAVAISQWQRTVAPVDPDALTASVNGRLHSEVARVFPDAVIAFGMAVLRAATRPATPSTCRYCVADLDARVHADARPRIDAATMVLLGRPCRGCMRNHVHQASARVVGGRTGEYRSGGRRGRGAGAPSDQSAVAPRPFGHSALKACALCTAARDAIREIKAARGLTASAAGSLAIHDPKTRAIVAAAVTPHAAVLAPTGRGRPVLHNGRGATENCNCEECRGARILVYRDRGLLRPSR